MTGHDDHCTRLATGEESPYELGFRLHVEGGRGFVHQDNSILSKERAGKCNPLSLTAGKIGTALGEWR